MCSSSVASGQTRGSGGGGSQWSVKFEMSDPSYPHTSMYILHLIWQNAQLHSRWTEKWGSCDNAKVTTDRHRDAHSMTCSFIAIARARTPSPTSARSGIISSSDLVSSRIIHLYIIVHTYRKLSDDREERDRVSCCTVEHTHTHTGKASRTRSSCTTISGCIIQIYRVVESA